MKITFLLPGYPAPIGGYRVVYEYANYLATKGNKISIVHTRTLKQNPAPKNLYKLLRRKTALFLMKIKKKNLEWLGLHKTIKLIYVKELIEKNIPDGDIIIASAWQTAEYMNDYSSQKGKKFYIVMDFPPYMGSKEDIESTWAFENNIITISSWLYEKVKKVRGEKNLINIPIGIPVKTYRRKSSIKKNKNQILMMYNKGRYKAAEDGIKALHIVLNKFPRLKIILFGKDNAPSNLPKNFEYRRNINETQLVELYNSSSIFVSSSISEGFGLPSAEAMSCECAVASTDCGGNRDFAIHNETALISKPGDYKSLAKNILILLNNDVLRDDLSKKSQAHIQNFNWDRAGNQLENFIINKVG